MPRLLQNNAEGFLLLLGLPSVMFSGYCAARMRYDKLATGLAMDSPFMVRLCLDVLTFSFKPMRMMRYAVCLRHVCVFWTGGPARSKDVVTDKHQWCE